MKWRPLAATPTANHVDCMIVARALSVLCLVAVPFFAVRAAEQLPETMPPPAAKPAAKGAPESLIPEEETACRARLRALGVTFEELAPIAEPQGCSASFPVSVSRLPGGVELRPDAVLTCAMAEATAGFVARHAAPASLKEFGSPLKAISQASSYVCRPRNGTAKLSEHAFANALDWAALELEDGTVIEVRAFGSSQPRHARLVSALQQAACGPFKTVLGPGSDADHADHFHFDLAQRRGGATFCQ